MATKRDFAATAEIIRRQAADEPLPVKAALGRVARDFAALYRAENPRFQAARFFEACGLTVNGDSWL